MTMPNYEYNPNAAQATIEILDPGDYEFVIGSAKAFLSKNDDGSAKNFGVRYSLKTEAGQRTVVSLYLHTSGSEGMAKRFQLAALGYPANKLGESKFNAEHGGDDWRLDFENGSVGEGWKQFEGQRVIGTVDVGENNRTGEPMQNFKSWRPLGS